MAGTIRTRLTALLFSLCTAGIDAAEIGWVYNRGNGGLRWVESPARSGAWAVEGWSDGSGNWNTWFYTDKPFPRGKNLRCTFRWWWNPGAENEAFSQEYGADRGVAIVGPWHAKPPGEAPPYADGEAMIDRYFEGNTRMRWCESGAVQNGPPVDDEFHSALRSAQSRESSVLIRVTLGDRAGARLEWSGDNGITWVSVNGAGGNTPIDTTGQLPGSQWSSIRVSGNPEVYVGFCPGFGIGRAFFADIVVKNDEKQFDVAEPDLSRYPHGPRVSWLTESDLAPKGKYYAATVPKTLDLAERAKLAVHGLTRFLDENDQYSTYGHGFFSTIPAFMVHDHGQSQNWGKIVDALVLAREMSGSTLNLDIELASLNGMMNYALLKMEEAYPVPLARMTMALISLNHFHPKLEIVDQVQRYADVLVKGMTIDRKRDHAYYGPENRRWERDDNENELGISGSYLQMHTHGQVLRALVMADALAEVQVDRAHLTLLRNFIMEPAFWQPETHAPLVVPAEHGQFWGHHHSYMHALLGLLYYAHLTGDIKTGTFVRASYEYMRTYGIARIGLFGESCTIGDMTYLAIRLSRWGVGDYWEDVDQYTRNHLVEMQITDTTPIRAVTDNHGIAFEDVQLEPWCRRITTNDVLNRCLGIYWSDASHPTLIPLRRNHAPNRSGLQWVVCCTGNCIKALFETWNAIVDYDHITHTAHVNLLMNRASPWLDIDSSLPYQGKVVIRNKTARTLLVRVPQWVDKAAVQCELGGRRASTVWTGNYLLFTGLADGTRIDVRFPMVETTETYSLAWREDRFWQESTRPPRAWGDPEQKVYTLRFRGNTLVDIAPRDRNPGVSLYADRSLTSFREESPKRSVERFVHEESLRGAGY